MKTYPYTENGEIIDLVKKSEHDAVVSELLQRLEERTQSHIHASARDVQMIQRQGVELSKWQALAESLATVLSKLNAWGETMWNTRPQAQRFGSHPCVIIEETHKALAAYESAKKGEQP